MPVPALASATVVQALTCVAILCLFAAVVTLLVESRMAIDALNHLARDNEAESGAV